MNKKERHFQIKGEQAYGSPCTLSAKTTSSSSSRNQLCVNNTTASSLLVVIDSYNPHIVLVRVRYGHVRPFGKKEEEGRVFARWGNSLEKKKKALWLRDSTIPKASVTIGNFLLFFFELGLRALLPISHQKGARGRLLPSRKRDPTEKNSHTKNFMRPPRSP